MTLEQQELARILAANARAERVANGIAALTFLIAAAAIAIATVILAVKAVRDMSARTALESPQTPTLTLTPRDAERASEAQKRAIYAERSRRFVAAMKSINKGDAK